MEAIEIMRKITFIITPVVFALLFLNYTFCQAKGFNLGINGGINYSRIASLDITGIHDSDYPKYTYPRGFNIGVIGEINVLPKLYFRTGFSLLSISSKVDIFGYAESIAHKEFHATFYQIPVVLRYQCKKELYPYILIGTDIGYLTKAQYKVYEPIEFGNWSYELDQELPRINISAVIGIGKSFKIYNNFSLLWEIKYILGLTNYKFERGLMYLGNWKNNILQLRFGVLL